MKYNCMFQKGRIGRLELKNRTVMSPMGTDFANPDGTASERLIRYYEERARGGIGLIINEYTGVDDVNSIPSSHNLRAARDYHIASLEQLTDAVHAHGCRIFAQLHHGGSTSKAALTGRQSLSSSDVPVAPGAPVPRPMTLDEIREAVTRFVEAAVRCKKAGYDGVELHGAHSYLLGQFFSPYYNRRTDSYGGSLENRMRLISEIIDGIRGELGPAFPISVRICGDEMTPEIPGTLTLEDGLEIGRYLEQKGIDVINISNGSGLNANANCDPYSYQPGWKKHVAKVFKEQLSIPVIATNTIKNPDFAEDLLEEGVCDFVALGRSQFADPDFVRKAREGRPEEIRQCIGCMYCRERLIGKGLTAACAVNARMGREHRFPALNRDGAGRPVAVIGAGPAGMEAARVLAERGFRVTLFEKEDATGGTLNVADKPRFKQLLTNLTHTMTLQLEKAGVELRLGTVATPDLVRELNPVAVFVATGAKPIRPGLPGIDSPHVHIAEDIITGQTRLSGEVAVIGTGLTGLEAAELLAEQGCALTLVEMQPHVGPGLFPVILGDILGRINRYLPSVLTGHRLTAVTPDGIRLEYEGDTVEYRADHVVLALGVSPDRGILADFEAEFPCVIPIGDAAQAGRIATAIKEGFDRAFFFEPWD